MRIETSTRVPANEVAENERRLRQAAVEAKHDKFFGPNEKLEVVHNPSAPSIEDIVSEFRGKVVKPQGNPTLCYLALQAALALCGGNGFCEAAAYIAYDICLKS